MLRSGLTTLLLTTAAYATAAPIPIDLSSWTSDGDGNWIVQGVNNDSVLQTINGSPTVFYEAGSEAQNTSISGTIEVQTTGDNDFIGFVLGYQAGELTNASSEFYLIDWKQETQSSSGVSGLEGLAFSVVNGVGSFNDFWGHQNAVAEKVRGTTLGSTGWLDNVEYAFDISFTSSLIEVFVNDVLEISITAAQAGLTEFQGGASGFYNSSQGNVRYAGIAEQVIVDGTVSTPTTLVLFSLGLFGIAGLRKTK